MSPFNGCNEMSLLYRRELALASKWMKGEGSQVTSKGNEK